MLSNRNQNSLQSSERPENVGGRATPRKLTRRVAASTNAGRSTGRCHASTSMSKYSSDNVPRRRL
eukprot:11166506-Heterocapsa_arctica.AAC.1